METTECKLSVKESSLAFVLGFIFAQVSVLVLVILVGIIASPFVAFEKINNFFYNNAWGYLLSTIVLDLALFGVYFYFNRKKENKIVSRPTAKKTLFYFLLTVATFFCLAPFINCFDTFLTKIGIELNEISYELNTKSLFPSLLSFIILPPIFEELLFRGVIFKGLKPYGKAFSVFFSGLFFAIFHMAIDQLIYQLLFGMLLAIIMYKENNILYTILMHATNNLLAFLFTYFDVALMVNHWAFILLAILLFVAFVALIIFALFKGNKTSKQTSLGKNKIYFIACLAIMIIVWIVLILTSVFSKT